MENCNPAAERAILSGILKGGYDTFLDVDDILKTDFFTLESSQIVYKCIKHVFEKDSSSKIDLTTILSTAHEIGLKDFFGEKSAQNYLRSLATLDISLENIRAEAKKVAKLAVARSLYDGLEQAQKELCGVTGSESISQIIGIAESKISELSLIDQDAVKTKLLGDGADKWLQNILDNPNKQVGISTGFGLHDASIGGGIRPGTVNLIVARLKTGKSFYVDNVGYHVSNILKLPVLNIDTEMSEDDHRARVCANIAGINLTKIETGDLSHQDIKKMKEAVEVLKSMPYHYRCVAGYPFEDVLNVMRRWIIKEVGLTEGKAKTCLVIYDYFKLMDQDSLKIGQEYQMLGFQMTTLTNFAVKYGLPVLAFAQTNRDGATEETVETIAGSDRLGWFASSISLFKKKSPEEIAQDGIENGNRKLIPLACRYGEGMDSGNYISMNFRGELGRITEVGTRNSMYKTRKEKEKLKEKSEEVAF